jgi:hypothetical protein
MSTFSYQKQVAKLVVELSDRLASNHTLLFLVSRHAPKAFCECSTIHLLQKLFVMSDDDELEIRLMSSNLDELMERGSKSLDVICIEIRSRFIKCNDLKSMLALFD